MPRLLKTSSLLSLFLTLICLTGFGQVPLDDDCAKSTDHESAIVTYTKAIKFSSTDYNAYVNRGRAYRGLGDHAAALKDFNRAIELIPKADKAYLERGILFQDRSDREKALDDFSKAIERNPFNGDAYYYRGRTYWGREKDLTLADFSKALELDPNGAYLYGTRAGASLMINPRDQAAVADLTKAVELLTAEMTAKSDTLCRGNNLLHRGWANAMLRRYPESIADFSAAIKEDVDDVQGYKYRAWILFIQKKYISALDDLDKAIKLNANYAEAYKARARVYDMLNQKERAAADRQKYQELSNSKPDPRLDQ